MTNQKGIALVVVLWMMVVVILMTITYSQTIHTAISLATNQKNHLKALSLAEEGVWRGVMILLDRPASDSLRNRYHLDGRVYSLSDDGRRSSLRVSFQSANGLIDINRAPKKVLLKLFDQYVNNEQQALNITNQLISFRSSRANSTSESFVNQGGVSDLSQLRNLDGMTTKLFDAVSPYLTIYSAQPRVAIKSAPELILQSLPGLDTDKAKALMFRRDQNDEAGMFSIIPIETRQYIGSGTNDVIYIRSLGEVGGAKAGVVSVIKMKPLHEALPVSVLSWQQEISPIFK